MAQEVEKREYQLPVKVANHLKEVRRLCEGMEKAYGMVTKKCHQHFEAIFPTKQSMFNHNLYLATVRALRPDQGTTTHEYRLFLAWTRARLRGLPTKSGKLREARGLTFKRWATAIGREYDQLQAVLEQSKEIEVDTELVRELRDAMTRLALVKAKIERRVAHPAYLEEPKRLVAKVVKRQPAA